MSPREGNPYAHRAFALCQLGNLEEALKDAKKAVQLSKFYVRGHCHLAYVLMQVHEFLFLD